LLTREVHCVLQTIPLEVPIQINLKLSLFGWMAGIVLLVSDCAGFNLLLRRPSLFLSDLAALLI
jgi:hypothetical protein